MTARAHRRPLLPDADGLARESLLGYPGGVTHRKVEALADDVAVEQ